jgi:transposase
MPRNRVRTTDRGVSAQELERASNAVLQGRSIRSVAEEFRVPVASLGRYAKRKRELEENGSNLLPSVGYKSCNTVFNDDQEGMLELYVRKAAALYYGLPPKEVGMHQKHL